MQERELRTWDDGLARPKTVGELIEFLRPLDADLPVYFTYDMGCGVAAMEHMSLIRIRDGRAGHGLYLEND